jgi:galactonate dehydratase
MLVYQWISGGDATDIAESARQYNDRGYRAFKFNLPREIRPLETPAVVDRVVNQVAAVRDAVGDDVLLGLDFHGRVSKSMAAELIRRLEPYRLMFVDQPVLPEQAESLGRIGEGTSIPIATGERFYSRYEFKSILADDSVSVIQPDVTHVGGISEMRKIVAMAEAFDVAVVPHCPLGPVAFAASLQVGFCSQNVVLQEQDLELHDPQPSQRLALLEEPNTFDFEDGYVGRPTGPGLGIQVDEDRVREEAQTQVDWYNPVWHHEDGSIAEW